MRCEIIKKSEEKKTAQSFDYKQDKEKRHKSQNNNISFVMILKAQPKRRDKAKKERKKNK